MCSFLNLYSVPHARDGARLDGARDNKQVCNLALSYLVLFCFLVVSRARVHFVARG